MRKPSVLVIFLTVFIDLIGFGIVVPLVPVYSTHFGAHGVVIGIIIASFSAMQFLFAPIWGRLSDRHGRRPILFISTAGAAGSYALFALSSGLENHVTALWLMVLSRMFAGACGGNITVAQAYIADITPPEERSKKMGLIGMAFGLGFIFGPAIGGILSRWGIAVPFFFAGGLALANATLLYFTLPETVTPDHPARTSAATGRWSQLLKALGKPRLAFILAIYFLLIVAFSIMTASFALFTMFRFGFDALHNGYLFMYVGVLGAVIQGGLIGHLVKRFGEMKLVVIGTLLFAASLFSFPFAGPHIGLAALLTVGAIFSIGNSLSTPTLTALASKSVGRGEQGGVLGVTQSVASLARAVGPVIGGLLIYSAMDVLGADGQLHKMSDNSIKATFWTAAGIMFVGFLLSLYFAWAHSTEYQNEEAMSEARA